jgi:DNA-binding transcriptional MerR regulator
MENVYLLKDVARITGHSKTTLKYYLKIGLIREASRSPETRFRYFDDTTVEQLRRVHELRREGRAISEIKHELLSTVGSGEGAVLRQP